MPTKTETEAKTGKGRNLYNTVGLHSFVKEILKIVMNGFFLCVLFFSLLFELTDT